MAFILLAVSNGTDSNLLIVYKNDSNRLTVHKNTMS